MHRVLGEPDSITRLFHYWTTTAVLGSPLLFALPPLRAHPAVGLVGLGVAVLLLHQVVVFVTNRLYDALLRVAVEGENVR